jgi:hypothetical protein
VQNCDTVEINGLLKKRWQIVYAPASFDDYIVDTWIEDIGSLHGILYPCVRLGLAGSIQTLLCHFQNDELIYHNPAYSECYYSSTSVQTITDNSYNVFPNPANDIVTISDVNNSILRIEIFNHSGIQVYSQAYTDKIDLSSFSKGLYLLKIYNTANQVSTFKIIKK